MTGILLCYDIGLMKLASKVAFPENEWQNILDEILSNIGIVISKVAGRLSDGFTESIAGSIFSGIQEMAKLFEYAANLEG